MRDIVALHDEQAAGGVSTVVRRLAASAALFAVTLFWIEAHPLAAKTAEPGALAENTPWATRYHVVDSGRRGPTVLVVGGVHGDEPAPPLAVQAMRSWRLTRGRLVLVPKASRVAVEHETRHTPGLRRGNLNRSFASRGERVPRGPLAEALWQLVESERPDWLLDLHEGVNYHRHSRKSVGNSIIRHRTGPLKRMTRRMLDAVNATVDDPSRRFVRLGPPVKGSLARAATRRLGVPSMILETTRLGPVSERIEQHHVMVRSLLCDQQMLDHACNR